MGAASAEDEALLRWCSEHDRLGQASLSWMCVLGVPGELILSCPSVHGNQVFLSGRSFAGSCLAGLPLEPVCIMANLFYRIAPLKTLHWLPIVDPTEWTCQSCTWICPLHVKADLKVWPREHGFLIATTSPKKTLLELSALNGFWQMPKTGLTTLAGQLKVPASSKLAFSELLLVVAKHILGELDDATKLSILRCRMPKSSDMTALLNDLDVEDVLEQADVEGLQKDKRSRTDAETDFGPAVRSLARKVRSSTSEGVRRLQPRKWRASCQTIQEMAKIL